MKDWFVIKNLEEFTDKTRAMVYNNFGKWDVASSESDLIDSVSTDEQGDLDSILPHKESLNIIMGIAKRQTNKKTKKIRYIINDKLFMDIMQDLNSRMISNVLSSLVKKGLVESSYDTELNDFVFWAKTNDENQDNIQPETD